ARFSNDRRRETHAGPDCRAPRRNGRNGAGERAIRMHGLAPRDPATGSLDPPRSLARDCAWRKAAYARQPCPASAEMKSAASSTFSRKSWRSIRPPSRRAHIAPMTSTHPSLNPSRIEALLPLARGWLEVMVCVLLALIERGRGRHRRLLLPFVRRLERVLESW